MARSRRVQRDLSESWDDIDDYGEEQATNLDQIEEVNEYRPTRATGGRLQEQPAPRHRNLRCSVEPELIMPSSPDATSARNRTSTPHFRQIERSMTSDAGHLRKKDRATTPHTRMNQRSMTSDAGHLRASKLAQMAEEDIDEDESVGASAFVWQRVVAPLLVYTADVFSLAMRNAKPILGWVVLLYIGIAAFIFGSGFVSNSINNALSPICRLPFTGGFSFCPARETLEMKGPAEFDKLVQAQDTFQDILASTSVGANLPLDMKRSEMSIRDLKNVVKYSKLPSRIELEFEFGGFIDTARQASGDLSRFNSRIGRAVDHILSTNRWTLTVIDGVHEQDAARGSLAKWASNNLNIFAPFQPLSLSRDVLLDQYLRHTDAVEQQIQHLIAEAQALRDVLDNLDGRLDVIAGIATRDGIKLEDKKDELFATLWTRLGGNRSTVTKLNQQITLLENVGTFRRVAWAHVTNTILKLTEIQNSLDDLRERVAMPEVVGTDTVPLEVHIDSINRGIERLEQVRDSTRQVEAERHQKILERSEAHDSKMIGGNEL